MRLTERISVTSLVLATAVLLVLFATIFSDLYVAVVVELLQQAIQGLF